MLHFTAYSFIIDNAGNSMNDGKSHMAIQLGWKSVTVMTVNSHCAPLCTLWNALSTFLVVIVWELVKIDFCYQQQNVAQRLSLAIPHR